MFAQGFMNKVAEKPGSFAETVEKPVFNGFIGAIFAGAIAGALMTCMALMQSITGVTLANAILAGTAVGASAGLLLFGLADVVIGGRLEEGCTLTEDADDFMVVDENKGNEATSRTLPMVLPKAS